MVKNTKGELLKFTSGGSVKSLVAWPGKISLDSSNSMDEVETEIANRYKSTRKGLAEQEVKVSHNASLLDRLLWFGEEMRVKYAPKQACGWTARGHRPHSLQGKFGRRQRDGAGKAKGGTKEAGGGGVGGSQRASCGVSSGVSSGAWSGAASGVASTERIPADRTLCACP